MCEPSWTSASRSGDWVTALNYMVPKCTRVLGSSEWGQRVLTNINCVKCKCTSSRNPPSTYHVLHVGRRRVNLASELVVKVQDELSVTVGNGPLPPMLGLPPVPLLVQILVQNLLPACGVWKHHHGSGCLKQQEQGHALQPVQRYMPHPGQRWR